MRQFVLPPSWDGGSSLVVSGKDARRLTLVLRLGPGDSFPALAPDGSAYTCTVQESGTNRVLLSLVPSTGHSALLPGYLPDIRAGTGGVHEPVGATPGTESATEAAAAQSPALSIPPIFLAVGLLKGSKLDEVVRAATEAGVAALIPLETERSMPKGEFGSRLERLRRLSREAIGQSGSAIPTRLEQVMPFHRFIEEYNPVLRKALGLYFHETPLAESSIHRYCTPRMQAVFACVGPEGGLSSAETTALNEAGFRPAWLGPAVLRAETAAIFAIASIRIICLERTSWSTSEYRE
ncbi:MAG: RsmE family RNA methyltransferase [Spirochaetia bacterium]|nr:RsmE family RNA methyltransferase [Spirochaetia bacterium]